MGTNSSTDDARAAAAVAPASGAESQWRGWLREAVLCVPDPADAAAYLAQLFGGSAGAGVVDLGSGTRLRLQEGPPGFAAAEFGLAHAGMTTAGEPADDGWLRDPDGRRLRVAALAAAEGSLEDAAPRLGHLTFESPDPLRAQAFYEQLGFNLTEGLAEHFRWLRCNPIHHTVAFSRSDAPRLHHVGIEVADRNEFVDLCDRLHGLGHRIQYGPGRHLVGNNLFLYFLDRHGIRFEVFCELERIDDPDRPPLVHENVPRERSVNLWGPQPPPEFFRGI